MRAGLCVYYVYDDDWRIALHSLLYFWCSNDAVQCETVGHRARCDMCPVSEQCWLHTICGLSNVFDINFYPNQQLCIICGNVKCLTLSQAEDFNTSDINADGSVGPSVGSTNVCYQFGSRIPRLKNPAWTTDAIWAPTSRTRLDAVVSPNNLVSRRRDTYGCHE